MNDTRMNHIVTRDPPRERHSPHLRQAVALIVLSALLAAGCWAATAWFRGQQLEHVRTHVTATAVARATSLSESINHRFALLHGLAAYATTTARPHEAEPGFDTFVPLLASSMSGISNMGVMPDGITKYIYPLKGNESVLGMSIFEDERPEVQAAVQRALSTREITLNDPYELRQGGLGLVARTGVWQGETLWGMVTMVLDMPATLDEAGLPQNDGVTLTALRDRSGKVFFGDQSVFDASPVLQRVALIDGSWELASVPVLGWDGAVRDDVRTFALGGAFIAVLILLSTYLALSRNSRLEQLIALRTAELERDRRERELLIQTIPSGIIFVDAAGKVTFANAAAERILELEVSVLQGHAYDGLAWSTGTSGGDPLPPDRLLFALVKASGKPVSDVRHAIVLPDERSKLLSVNAAPVFTIDGTFSGMVASLQDITERSQAEERLMHKDELLRMSEIDLRQAQAVAHVGSWRWDIAHDKFVWSDEMCRIFGIAPHAFIGSLQDVIARAIHPDDRARIEESDRAIIEDHNPQPLEYRIVWPDGSVRIVWAETGEMTLDDKGHVSSLTGVVLDITDRKRAEAEKEEIQARLAQSQKMEAIGQLAGGVAHDFNNLLTGILGNVELVRDAMLASDPLRENLSMAETAARQAADLAKGLLTFSRRAVVSAVPLDMAEAVDTTLAILKQSLPATMDIVRDVEQPAWSVLADRSQIAQVILNLAVNARDAMQGKGTLTVRLRNVQVDGDYVRTHPFARTGDFVHLSVADTGPGIPQEIRSHLFEPFHTTKPAGSGTGLGLSIVYGATKQAGGWVTADSPTPEDVYSIQGVLPGAGTVFDIFLPRCLDEPSVPAVPARFAANVCSGTVLVVEDEPVVCAVTQALLTRSGYTVLTAGDGASALVTFREHPGTVNLVLLDMTMPGMTTEEILAEVRRLYPVLPVLLTSGYTSSDAVKHMLDDGIVQGFLAKPYETEVLFATVARLMRTTEGGPR